MKKGLKTLLLPLLALTLASCGGTTTTEDTTLDNSTNTDVTDKYETSSDDTTESSVDETGESSDITGTDETTDAGGESSNSDSSSDDGSSQYEADGETAFEEFMSLAEEGTGTISDPTYATKYYLGNAVGFVFDYCGEFSNLGAYGYINIDGYGCAEVEGSLTDGLEIVSWQSKGNRLIYDMTYSLIDIAEYSDTFVQDETNEYEFVTESSSAIKVACNILGYGDLSNYLSYYNTAKLTLIIDSNCEEANMNLTLADSPYKDSGLDDISCDANIWGVGDTSLVAVDELIENFEPVTPTNYSGDFLEALSDLGYAGELPFYNGSYCNVDEIEYDDNNVATYISHKDFACGDVSNDFAEKLISAGFEFDAELSDLDGTYGYIDYVYSKVIGEETETKYAPYLYVEFYYYPVSEMSESSAALYPDGTFYIFIWSRAEDKAVEISLEDLNKAFSEITENNARIFPELTLDEKLFTLTLTDSTEAYNEAYGDFMTFACAYSFEFTCTEENANTLMEAIINQLLATNTFTYDDAYDCYSYAGGTYTCDAYLQKNVNGSEYAGSFTMDVHIYNFSF